MDETAENQEAEDIQLNEAEDIQLNEAEDIQLDEAEEENALEEIRDELAFLRDNSDDLSLYLAFKAYHDDQDYEEAIKNFASAIDYEQQHGAPSEVGADGEDKPNEVLVRSFYWMAESHLKIQQNDKALEMFETISSNFDNHYLGQAAQRRLDRLKVNE